MFVVRLACLNLRRVLRRFKAVARCNVAIIFALAVIPILAFVGLAVDYSRANSLKAKLQTVLDATALMVAGLVERNAATLTNTQIQAAAESYFLAQFQRPEAKNVKITATYSNSGGSQLLVSGSADMDTEFLSVIGFDQLNVSGTAAAAWGGSYRLRVALVLDNTGSMAQSGKIDALKTATKNLLTQLQNAVSTPGDVYVSIIPFVKDVSVDPTNYNSSWDNWIEWGDHVQPPDNSWDGANGTCSISGYSPRSKCIAQSFCSLLGYTSQSSCTGAGTCSVSTYTSQNTCTSGGTCTISGHSSQSSCTSASVCSISDYSTQSSCRGAGECSKSNYTTQSKCTSKGYVWTTGVWAQGVWTAAVWTPGVWTQATWTPNSHSTWNGCFTDRGTSPPPVRQQATTRM